MTKTTINCCNWHISGQIKQKLTILSEFSCCGWSGGDDMKTSTGNRSVIAVDCITGVLLTNQLQIKPLWSGGVISRNPAAKTRTDRGRGAVTRASVTSDLLRRLHTAMQYSSESKLLRLPAQPPYMKRTHFLWFLSKCQRGMEARQGPVSASRVHTAARGQLVKSSGH